jgi:hypothetical protein
VLAALVWAVIAVTGALRVWVIADAYFWQDDYIHIWRAWNAPAADVILQNWNGHREPASFAVQWLVARVAPQVWWPAALVLAVIATATSAAFWLMLRRWGGQSPATAAAAVLFAAWPATMVAQRWWSAGLETVPMLLILVAGFLLARPTRWTPWAVGALAATAWLFHERAVYFGPFLFAVAWLFSGRTAWRDNRASWMALVGVTAGALLARTGDALPGRDAGTSIPGAVWHAATGSLLRSVLGWLPYTEHGLLPDAVGLWGVAVLMVWAALFLAGLAAWPRRTLVVAAVVACFLIVEVLSFVWLRGGTAGSMLAADPRFTLVTGMVLLAGIGALPVARPAALFAVPMVALGVWSIWRIGATEVPGRQWLERARAVEGPLAATPSPPQMLAHFFFTTTPPIYELGTTRTLLQVGQQPPQFPEVATDPVQIDGSGVGGPLEFTPLLVDDVRRCRDVPVPHLRAGVRVVRMALTGDARVEGIEVEGDTAYVFPPPGPVPPVAVTGACVTRTEVGVPGR